MNQSLTKYFIISDRSGLEQTSVIEELQGSVLEALKHYSHRRRPTQPNTFAKMLVKMADLRALSLKGEWYDRKTNWLLTQKVWDSFQEFTEYLVLLYPPEASSGYFGLGFATTSQPAPHVMLSEENYTS